LGIMNIVQKAGTGIALPSQTLYIAGDTSRQLAQPIPDNNERPKADALH